MKNTKDKTVSVEVRCNFCGKRMGEKRVTRESALAEPLRFEQCVSCNTRSNADDRALNRAEAALTRGDRL